MEIKKFYLHALQNMEYFQFASHVIAMCEENGIEKIKAVLKPLKTAVAEEDKALNLPRKQEGTADLEELDRVRDQAYRALQLLIEMHSYSEDTTKQKSAQQMNEVMSRYPKLASANYDKETGMIKNLVTDLNAAELSPAVTQLGASNSVMRLSVPNSDFELSYRSLLKTALPSGTFDVKALRATTDKALNAVIRRMDSLDDLEPETPKLAVLIQQYNALVDKRRLTLAHRAGTSQVARNKRTAEYEALLKPGFAALEQLLGIEKGSLSFTGKTEGTGAKRHYELGIKGQTLPDGKPKTIWVGVNKDGSLFRYEKKMAKPKPGMDEKPEYEIKPKAPSEG